MNIEDFSKKYLSRLTSALDRIDYNVVGEIIEALEKSVADKSRIFIIGNGGSSATASHMVNDLGVGLKRREIINFDIASLNDNVPVVSAIANDVGYESIFSMQMKGLLSKNDIIIAISCSGDSPNIVKAVDYAKEIGCTIIGLSGFEGGYLRKVSDISFHVDAPEGDYGLVEDVHMILDHIIYSYYMHK